MKILKMFIVLSFLVVGSAWAKVFTIEKTKYIDKNVDEIIDIFLDYDNYCDSGCKYKLSDIEDLRMLEWVDDNHFYSWAHVAGMKTYKYFNYVTIEKTNNSVRYITTYPSSSEVKRLKKKYGLPHNAAFDKSYTSWEFKPTSKGVKVTFKGKFNMSSWIADMFGHFVDKGLKQTSVQMFKALES